MIQLLCIFYFFNIILFIYSYDDAAAVTAPRLWWTFKCFNKTQPVAILNGGLKKWVDEDSPVVTDTYRKPIKAEHPYVCDSDIKNRMVTMAQIKLAIKLYKEGKRSFTTIDARSCGRFCGKDPEPRIELCSGHIPGSKNIPFTELVKPVVPEWRSLDELKNAFDKIGVDIQSKQPIICSCGSGCTACYIAFALHLLGRTAPGSVKVYDGSWCEWAADKENEIVKDL